MVTTPKNAPGKVTKSTASKAKSSTGAASRSSGAAARKTSPAAAKTPPVKSAPSKSTASSVSAAKAPASDKQATVPTRRTVTTSSAMEAAVKTPEQIAKSEPAQAAASPASASTPPTKQATSDVPKAQAAKAPAKAPEPAKPVAAEPVKKAEAAVETAKAEKAVTAKAEAEAEAKAVESSKPASPEPKAAPVAKGEVTAKAQTDANKDSEPVALEAFISMWAPPALEEFFDPSRFGLEEGMAAANQVAEQFADVVSDQVDLLSDAGTRMACNCEDFWKSHSQGWDGLYQASSKMAEKSGSIGTEMMAWMQHEYDASQADLEKLSKVENLSDFQELQASIISRQVETGLSEATKIRNIWFDMLGEAVSLGSADGK